MGKSAVILAGGEGKRMKSDKPKALSQVLDKPMLRWVIDSVTNAGIDNVDLGLGKARVKINLDKSLFCKVLGEKTGIEIADEADMLKIIVELTSMKSEFDKIKAAYDDVMETGYGIVMPSMEELTLEEPQIIRQGTKYGIKLRASAPSIHMLRTNITTEVTPIVGSEQQSEESAPCLTTRASALPRQVPPSPSRSRV